MANYMNTQLLTDESVLKELGERLARRRLDARLTQAGLAMQAGVSKRTVERLEAGGSIQLVTLIRILRVLDLLGGLDQWIPEVGPRPMDLLKLRGRVRQRVRESRKPVNAPEKWTWGEGT